MLGWRLKRKKARQTGQKALKKGKQGPEIVDSSEDHFFLVACLYVRVEYPTCFRTPQSAAESTNYFVSSIVAPMYSSSIPLHPHCLAG